MGSYFSGNPLTRWDGERNMVLEEEIYFIDKNNYRWIVPRHAIINGATIPRPLWNVIGSPYVGLYRRASVIHDYFVGENGNPPVSYPDRRLADRMFFEACRVDGCNWRFAAMLYIGVSVGTWFSTRKVLMANKSFEMQYQLESIEIQYKYNSLRTELEDVIQMENFDLLEAEVEQRIQI